MVKPSKCGGTDAADLPTESGTDVSAALVGEHRSPHRQRALGMAAELEAEQARQLIDELVGISGRQRGGQRLHGLAEPLPLRAEYCMTRAGSTLAAVATARMVVRSKPFSANSSRALSRMRP